MAETRQVTAGSNRWRRREVSTADVQDAVANDTAGAETTADSGDHDTGLWEDDGEGFWDEAGFIPGGVPAEKPQAQVRRPQPADFAAIQEVADDDPEVLEALNAERETLESIYDTEFEAVAPREWRIQVGTIPASAAAGLGGAASLHVLLPQGYPLQQDPPVAWLDCPVRDETLQSLAASAIEELLAEWQPMPEGCVCPWVEHLRSVLQPALEEYSSLGAAELLQRQELSRQHQASLPSESASSRGFTYMPANPQFGQRSRHFDENSVDSAYKVEILHGEPIVDRKSTFVAHAAKVETEAQVQWVLRELLSDSKVAVATHNIFAYRFYDTQRGVQVADNDDDGEDGAGSKLAALLSMSGSEGVFVMVSRWYGGIHLGADRFKHISRAASTLLDSAGWTKRGAASAGANDSRRQKR
mmetsp:Transcript_26490/g.40238  ORF Transcript_26490/g.40238 Transcript_26490/m.40238 type:complete len:415 (-) Transcript_26490:25-1269(-)